MGPRSHPLPEPGAAVPHAGPQTVRTVRVHAPHATRVHVVVRPSHALTGGIAVEARQGPPEGAEQGSGNWVGNWVAEVSAADGDLYWIVVDDGPPLLDPSCLDMVVTAEGPRSVFRGPWPRQPRAAPLAAAPLVYELHVKGFGGGYLGCIDRLDHVVATGANVIELLPVHPFDDSSNYWGYMPLVWGAVHRGYARERDRAAEELGRLIAEAHRRGLHVWLDVVFNHTGEDGREHAGYGLRGFDEAGLFRHGADGALTNDSGCGNDIDPGHPYVRHLVLEALDRFVDLGVDGFRFDLASLLTRDGGGLIDRITDWGRRRRVTLVAEAWDLGSYQVGPGWPWASWWQWNDRFRDDVRRFVRGENGMVHAVRQRVQGSPDLFGDSGPARSLNFLTAHDGLTMHDLTALDSDRHLSWNCGLGLRMQQLKNFFTLLLLSAGGAMWVMGDEFARTQDNHDNPYDIDGPLTWVDWQRAEEWAELTRFVRALNRLRLAHPPSGFRFYGVGEQVDESDGSHSFAWCANGLYVMVNAWWESLTFEVQEPGEWRIVAASSPPGVDRRRFELAARSVVVLELVG